MGGLRPGPACLVVATACAAAFAALPVRAQSTDFGTPPSGSIPIIFDDRHVYAKPDTLVHGRVLAALARGADVLVPLRSLLEELGGSVAYDPRTRTTLVRKAGTSIVVRVGLASVIVNGEARPLDVPPEARDGIVYVPLRVLAESLGAYVQYLPDRHAVVVRTVSAVPLATSYPTAAPTQAAAVASGATPTPGPRPIVPPGPPAPTAPPQIGAYVVGDAALSPRVSNAFAPGVVGASGQSYDVRGDITDLGPFAIGGGFAETAYAHPAGNVTTIGGAGATNVPAFTARDRTFDTHLGIGVVRGGYLDVGYLRRTNTYGYPTLGGFGVGFEAIPQREQRLALDAAVAYYPNLSGTCSAAACPTGPVPVAGSLVRYRAGLAFRLAHPFLLVGGYEGDMLHAKAGLPVGASSSNAYVGIGVRL